MKMKSAKTAKIKWAQSTAVARKKRQDVDWNSEKDMDMDLDMGNSLK